jgi:hypothetical protein
VRPAPPRGKRRATGRLKERRRLAVAPTKPRSGTLNNRGASRLWLHDGETPSFLEAPPSRERAAEQRLEVALAQPFNLRYPNPSGAFPPKVPS